jgi:hypothetical protein
MSTKSDGVYPVDRQYAPAGWSKQTVLVVIPGHSTPQTITLGGYRRILDAAKTSGVTAPRFSCVRYRSEYVMPAIRANHAVDSTWKSKILIPRARALGPMEPTPSRVSRPALPSGSVGGKPQKVQGPFKLGFYRADKRLAMRQASSIKNAMYKNCKLLEVPVKATHMLHLILHKLIRLGVDRGFSQVDYRNLCRIRQIATFSSSHAEAIGKAILCRAVPPKDWRLPLSATRRPFYDPGKSLRTYRNLRKRHKGLSKSYFDPSQAAASSQRDADSFDDAFAKMITDDESSGSE